MNYFRHLSIMAQTRCINHPLSKHLNKPTYGMPPIIPKRNPTYITHHKPKSIMHNVPQTQKLPKTPRANGRTNLLFSDSLRNFLLSEFSRTNFLFTDSKTGNVVYDEKYISNSRRVELFTCSWIPVNQEPKALVFICHGYAMECSITMKSTATRLVKAGFACYGIDYEGHGKSGGLVAYIDEFDHIVQDCSEYFSSICEKEENKTKKRYLLGESMGGAVALMLHLREKHPYWHGAVLVAPMCKIADELKPHPVVIYVLSKLSKFIPTWKIIPDRDIIGKAFQEDQIRREIENNRHCYKGRIRLKTGYELLRVSQDLENKLKDVGLPFIVLHGEDDKVIDKAVSQLLYDQASSSDKTLKLYPGMWHGLLYGEPQDNIDSVFQDIISWLENKASMDNSRLERELKHSNDCFISE